MAGSSAPLLARPAASGTVRARQTQRTAAACILALCIFLVFFKAVTSLEAALHTRPHLFPLLPALAIACIAAIVPLGLYVGCAADFGDVNPATPGGYVAVVRKTYRAFGENRATGKVGAKDL